jgi:trimethylamine--corrinoid protein Co-methyltransferase
MLCKILTDGQIERIHEKSLEILQRVGIQVPHQKVLELFAEYGAEVDFERERVRLPASLVMSLVEKAGKSFSLYGRDISRVAEFGAGKRNYNSSAGQAFWVDEIGGPRRYAEMEDVGKAARIADGLRSINMVGPMADPHSIPVEVRCVEVAAELIRNTSKPIHLWFHDRATASYIMEMLLALRGNRQAASQYPLCYPFLEPISPLRFPFHGLDLLFETSTLGLPVPVGPMAQTGLSAPATLAATMAQENAEILAGICITQLIKPGTPVCYGGICHIFDMVTTQIVFSGPEQALFGIGLTQVGKRYGFPVYVNNGMTDSKSLDAQCGLEVGINLALAAGAGADIFGHLGICGADQGASLDILVMQDEVIAYIERILREIDFSDDAFALDVIEEVGPGGTFIDQVHTVRHWREELWIPALLDRQYFQNWLDHDGQTLQDRCREKKEHLLKNHVPEPVPAELERELAAIVRSARVNLLKR